MKNQNSKVKLKNTSFFNDIMYTATAGIFYTKVIKSFVRKVSANILKKDPKKLLLVNANIFTMDEADTSGNNKVLKNYSLLIENGKILKIGKNIDISKNTMRVNCTGKYIIPGLVDSHVHIEDENELLLYLANGVTTVRNMWGNRGIKKFLGFPDQKKLKEEINNSKLIGPNILTTGPIIDGKKSNLAFVPKISTAKKAKRIVNKQINNGYDFLKVHDHTTKKVYEIICKIAKERGIDVVGHVPYEVSLDEVLDTNVHRSIEHLTGYYDMYKAQYIIPENQLIKYINKTIIKNIYNVPTVAIYSNFTDPEDIEKVESREEMKYVSKKMKKVWRIFTKQIDKSRTVKKEEYIKKALPDIYHIINALNKNGAKIVLGTDTDAAYIVAGFAVHDELQHYVNAGLTPYQALKTATTNAAEMMRKENEFGKVQEGMRADLLVLNKNPLKDISNTKDRYGTVCRGVWFDQSELDGLMEELAVSNT